MHLSYLCYQNMEIHKGHKTAMIVGATGLIGNELLSVLLDHAAYNVVKVIVRRATGNTHPKLKELVVDFDHLVKDAFDFMVCDDLYICLGTTISTAGSQTQFYRVDYKYVVLTAEMAHRQGAKQILLVSSVGADSSSKVFYSRVKGQVEEAILPMPFWSIHIFRPSLLLGNRSEKRPLESIGKMASRGVTAILGNKLGRYRPIEAQVVAKAMSKQAQQLDRGVFFYDSDVIYNIGK